MERFFPPMPGTRAAHISVIAVILLNSRASLKTFVKEFSIASKTPKRLFPEKRSA
jgi:hypothetical protein